MNNPDSPTPPRPWVPPQRPKAFAPGPPLSAPRIMKSEGAPPPVPGAIIRSLQATRGWTLLCCAGLLLIGIGLFLAGGTAWRSAADIERLYPDLVGGMELMLMRADAVVKFLLGGACLYSVPRLFRYAGAISRLRAGRRMGELERALSHQRAVWRALGAAGMIWLISFLLQLAYYAYSAYHSEEASAEELIESWE